MRQRDRLSPKRDLVREHGDRPDKKIIIFYY